MRKDNNIGPDSIGHEAELDDKQVLALRMGRIRHKILVLSGKGGVGKSTLAANLGLSLSTAGKKVGLLDIDIHGPSIPRLLGLEGRPVEADGKAMRPVAYADGFSVMSIGFLLQEKTDAVIWRGPLKYGVIKQFLKDVLWGDLDYLVIDSPPGTGDEPLSIAQLITGAGGPPGGRIGTVIITTPQELSLSDVRKSISFCNQVKLPVLGVVENMSGFICASCGTETRIFKSGGGETMAYEMGVPFLGRIPIDPIIAAVSDEGTPYVIRYPRTETARAFNRIIKPILELDGPEDRDSGEGRSKKQKGESCCSFKQTNREDMKMKIAIPIVEGKLSAHFGHCQDFALIDVDKSAKQVSTTTTVPAPEHQPGLLPRWLAEQGATVIIAGGMGMRAQSLFAESGIQVVTGAPCETPEVIAKAFLAGTLVTGNNICDH